MEGPEVREGGSGPHWVRVEWGDPDHQEAGSSSGDLGARSASGIPSPDHPASPSDVGGGGGGGGRVSDSYESYLELAYAKDVEPDAFLQDEDGLEEGPLEEEIDRTEVFPDRPRQVFTLQVFCPRKGWTAFYRGSGRSYVVEGLTPSHLVKVRVRMTQDDHDSPWTAITLKTKNMLQLIGADNEVITGLPGSGHDLVEAVQEDNATLVREVLADLHKFSQIERMDHVVESGHTPLVAAVASGSRDAVAVLLERRAAVASATAGPHLTPLTLAAWLGRADLARRLRAAGASWNHPDRNGLTPLHYCVAAGQTEMVRAALKEGASAHSTLTLALAAAHRRIASGRWSREEVEAEAMKLVEVLVEGGAEVDQRGAGGNTALHVALLLGLAPLARKLVSVGGDVEAVNGRGYTPTHLSTLCGHPLHQPTTPTLHQRPPMDDLEALTHLMNEEHPTTHLT